MDPDDQLSTDAILSRLLTLADPACVAPAAREQQLCSVPRIGLVQRTSREGEPRGDDCGVAIVALAGKISKTTGGGTAYQSGSSSLVVPSTAV